MNAKDKWLEWYETLRYAYEAKLSYQAQTHCREEMKRYRREAALERQIAAQQRRIDTLAALVRLKYGNLDPDVNAILESVGHGWTSDHSYTSRW